MTDSLPQPAIDAGAQAAYEHTHRIGRMDMTPWDQTPEVVREGHRGRARAVLEAASEVINCPGPLSPVDNVHFAACVCGGSGTLVVLIHQAKEVE